MDNILPTNEYTEVEGRVYSNPQVVIDEANSFIDNLRSTQAQNNQEITQQTQNLGTDISTNLGGLTGADSYFTSRYQTPQTVSAVANLRTTAQAAALNEVLENEQEKWKKRYNDAYRKYQKRAYDKANSGGSGGSGGGSDDESGKGDVGETATDFINKGYITLDEDDILRGGRYVQSMDTNKYGGHDIIWVSPSGENITIPQLSNGEYATKILDTIKNLPFYGGK